MRRSDAAASARSPRTAAVRPRAAGRCARRTARTSSAAPCATCCWSARRASSTSSSRATSTRWPPRSASDGRAHERFGTATVVRRRLPLGPRGRARRDATRIRARCPTCGPATIDEDLRRRDVTVNAIALDLAGGRLLAVEHALDDLRGGPPARAARRELARRPDAAVADRALRAPGWASSSSRTRRALAAAAVAAGAAERVSGARIGNELRLALGEPDPVAALEAAVALGLAPWLRARPRAHGGRAGAAARRRGSSQTSSCSRRRSPRTATTPTSGSPGWTSRRPSARCCARPRARRCSLRRRWPPRRPSELARALRGLPVEAVALAGAWGAAGPVRRWLDDLRHVALAIDGDDLLAAGVPRGPQIGRLLAATLDRRLDGELGDGRDEQLASALALT